MWKGGFLLLFVSSFQVLKGLVQRRSKLTRDRVANLASPPKKLSGKQFEELCMKARSKTFDISRFGTQSVWTPKGYQPIKSLPDFDAILLPGHQVVIECKTTQSTSLALNEAFIKKRQLEYMFRRSKYGATCLLLIHFNENKTREAYTSSIVVDQEHKFWHSYKTGVAKSITLEVLEKYGIEVDWILPPRAKQARPDLESLVRIWKIRRDQEEYYK